TLPSNALQDEKVRASYFAHQKLTWNEHYRTMCNYDAHLYQSEAELDPLTVGARKLFWQAEHARRFEGAPDVAVPLYEEAWPLWIRACVKYPKFIYIQSVQEDAYELNWHYVRLSQRARAHVFQPVLLAMAQLAVWPHPSWEEWRWIDPSQKMQISRVRTARGPIDGVQYYNGPEAGALRDFLLPWTQAATAYRGTAFAPPILPLPDQQLLLLCRWAPRDTPPITNWVPLVTEAAVNIVNVRLGLK